jgi:hypothetical protein
VYSLVGKTKKYIMEYCYAYAFSKLVGLLNVSQHEIVDFPKSILCIETYC